MQNSAQLEPLSLARSQDATVGPNFTCYTNGSAFFIGISTIEKKSPHVKDRDDFSRVWDGQSTAGTSLALFSAKTEWLRVLFFKRERTRLFLVAKVFV